jgi:GTP-binding protein
MPGLIAIVGRPNVGKSALFNRIAGRRIAIVHDQPGVTRDRVSAEVEWNGRPFTLVDTGGLGLRRGEKATDAITEATVGQVQLAIEAADVIVFVVNVQEGVVPLDLEVAERLRSTRKPVLVAVNKADQDKAALGTGEFSSLGFERMFPVSAIHGYGIDSLVEAGLGLLPPETGPAESATAEPGAETVADPDAPNPDTGRPARALRLAIVGRPNVGKSSLINALTGSERVIVSPIPGTTRDAVDVPFEVVTEGRREQYLLIDTAGVRKARRVDSSVEFFSVERTKDAIGRCDIAILILDAESGILEQDKKIADVITERRRACIVVVNKWDLLEETVRRAREQEVVRRPNRDRDDRRKRLTTLAEFGEWVQSKLFFLDYAPVIFTSAKSGFQLDRLLESVRYVAAQLRQSVATAILNRTLNDAVERRQPISATGARLKFFYATQVKQAPPTFLLFVNRDELFSETYTRHLAGEMRKAFGYEGCPIVLVPRARPKTIAPMRQREGTGGRRGTGNRAPSRPRTGRISRSRGGKMPPRSRFDKTRGRGLTRKMRHRRK